MNINVALLTEENHSECSDLMKLSALQTLAAAYRELTTLRPMSEAPKDGSEIIVYATDTVSSGYAKGDPIPPMWSVTSYHPDAGFCVCELREPIGWLPLPEVTE